MKSGRIMAEAEHQLEMWKLGRSDRPTVSSVARACGISRQAIYRSHLLVVAAIRSASDTNHAKDTAGLKVALLRDRLERETEKVTILTTLCGELAATLHDARDELASLRARLDRLKRSTRA